MVDMERIHPAGIVCVVYTYDISHDLLHGEDKCARVVVVCVVRMISCTACSTAMIDMERIRERQKG